MRCHPRGWQNWKGGERRRKVKKRQENGGRVLVTTRSLWAAKLRARYTRVILKLQFQSLVATSSCMSQNISYQFNSRREHSFFSVCSWEPLQHHPLGLHCDWAIGILHHCRYKGTGWNRSQPHSQTPNFLHVQYHQFHIDRVLLNIQPNSQKVRFNWSIWPNCFYRANH